jgi:hypothetical protein
MRRFAALGLVLMLVAFAPPAPDLDDPERAQQSAPKNWIPEPKPKPPPAVYHAIPFEEPVRKTPDTCANGYVAPKIARPADLPPDVTVMTPEQMFEKACATKPPEKPDRQLVDCPTSREIKRIELAKPLSDAYWLMGRSVYGDALAALERAASVAHTPEELFAVALARTKRARLAGETANEIAALLAQLETGCLTEFKARIVKSTIEYLEARR